MSTPQDFNTELPIAVSEVGAITSVGRGMQDSFASILAGMSRSTEVSGFKVFDGDEHDMVPLIGHPVAAVTEGFSALARWRLLADHALGNLIQRGKTPGAKLTQTPTGCAIVLPTLEGDRFYYDRRIRPPYSSESLLSGLLIKHGLNIPLEQRGYFCSGHAGIGEAILALKSKMEAGAIHRGIIIAVDSMLDGFSLLWLNEAGRLKTPDSAHGLAPGEAAVALILERADALQQRGGKPMAWLKATACSEDDYGFWQIGRTQGRGLINALNQATQNFGPDFQTELYTDINGEHWRSTELGMAIPGSSIGPSLAGGFKAVAESVGETGAASGALNIAIAAQALALGQSQAPYATILSSSDYGDTCACILQKAML
ncbi:hypothetical protein EUZ85_21615 [Hahella sp. KA22]|uniref:hypothetical protein n=1 Tax=Hahella sp. KA22 TaxID=1628392 RepID=UPI000FDDEF70|nr:hypothetical protein [Hahella sp. KA22]AZZ93178.1 hypothetical protein ENC22_19035 [Hahella sp. KA22]QAY56551.1 hypothetical protein EUZ85_21615 [Hahella sp. KA22]